MAGTNDAATKPLNRLEKAALMRETLSGLGRDAEYQVFAAAMRQHGQHVKRGNYYAARSKLWGKSSGNGDGQRKARTVKHAKAAGASAPAPAAASRPFSDLIELRNLCARLGGFDSARQFIDLLQELSRQ